MASWTHLLYLWVSGGIIVELSQDIIWFSHLQWSEMADFKFSCLAFSFSPRVRQTICFSHSFFSLFSCDERSLCLSDGYFIAGFTWDFINYVASIGLGVFCLWGVPATACGLMIVPLFCFLIACCIDSVTPLMYGILIMFLNCSLSFHLSSFFVTLSFVYSFAVYLCLLPNSDIGSFFLKLLLCVVLLVVCLPSL